MSNQSMKRDGLPNNRMNLTRSAQQTDYRGPCRLSACSTGVASDRRAVRRVVRMLFVIAIIAMPVMPASAIFCPLFVYIISVQTPADPGWFFKAVAPDREARKVEREEQGGVTTLKVFWGSTSAEYASKKGPCAPLRPPTSFLLTAQKDGKTLEYRFRIPEDMELVAGSNSVPRSKKPIVMQPVDETHR